MQKLVDLHNRILMAIIEKFSPWLLPTAARFTFASVLLLFFWNSGKTKLGENIFTPSIGAYGQILPQKLEAVGYIVGNMSGLDKMIVLMGTYAEFILPTLVVIGLFTRLSSLAMIGFVVVMSIVDITGHGADPVTIGNMFDRVSNSLIMDQRMLWILMLLVLVIKGGGPLSVDRLLRIK